MEIFGEKRDPEITDDQTALISGNWKRYNFGGERGCSLILESIHFQIYKPTSNESHPWQPSYHLGNYPVYIEAGELLIYTVKDKSTPKANRHSNHKTTRYQNISSLASQHDIYPQVDTGSLNEMPLYTRAWVLQERYLPKRVIHFGRDQTF